jgi:hypothetical protein
MATVEVEDQMKIECRAGSTVVDSTVYYAAPLIS